MLYVVLLEVTESIADMVNKNLLYKYEVNRQKATLKFR